MSLVGREAEDTACLPANSFNCLADETTAMEPDIGSLEARKAPRR